MKENKLPAEALRFKEYQTQKGYAKSVVNRHIQIAQDYENWLKTENTKLEQTDYNVLMNYVYHQKSLGNKTRTLQGKLTALSHYFKCKKLDINPTLIIKLQSDTSPSPHGLLGKEELDNIFQSYPTHGLINKRDKVLLSLAIYQGVSSGEFPRIELKDVNLEQGTIYIPAMRTTNARTMELKANQLLLIQNYLLKVRPRILMEANKTSDKLLVSTGQSENQLANVVAKIIKTLRYQHLTCEGSSGAKCKNLQHIRQSLITRWVQEYGLRKAQYLAGHRYVSSTERYNESARESLKNALKTAHPL